MSRRSAHASPGRPGGARSNANRSTVGGGCQPRPPPRAGWRAGWPPLLFLLLPPLRPRHSPAGLPWAARRRLPLPGGGGRALPSEQPRRAGAEGAASPAPPPAPPANRSGDGRRPRLTIGRRRCQSEAAPAWGAAGGGRWLAGSVRAGERAGPGGGGAAVAPSVRSPGGRGAPEPRSPGLSGAREAARKDRVSSSLPGTKPSPPPRPAGAWRSASARREQRQRRPSLRAGGRGQPAEEQSEEEEDVSAAAPPRPPRCAEPSRAASGNGGDGTRRAAAPGGAGERGGGGQWMDAAARLFPLCARAVMRCGGCGGGEAAAPLRVSPTHPHASRPPRRPRPAAPVSGCAGPGRAGAAPRRARGSPVSVSSPRSVGAAGRGEGRGHSTGLCLLPPNCEKGEGRRAGGINKKTFSPSEINGIGFARL